MVSKPANALNLSSVVGTVIWDGTTTISTNAQKQIYYVSKNGNDSNAGTTIDIAFLTFGAAITAATALTPSATNRFVITCLDDGIYTENLTTIPFIDIFAPSATLTGTLVVDDSSNIKFFTQNVATGTTGITKPAGSTYSNVEIEIINCAGTANGCTCSTGFLNLIWKQLYVVNGYGIGDISVGLGHLHIRGGDIYISGTGIGIIRANIGTTVGFVDHMLNIGGGTGTAIIVYGGTVDVSVTKIEVNQTYQVQSAGSVLNLFCNEIISSSVSSASLGGIANVWTVPTYPANQVGMANGQLVIGSTGANPVVASLTAGANVTVTNGAGTITLSAGTGTTSIVIQKFIYTGGSQTYTPTSGMVYAEILCLGGGGGGGGGATTGAGQYSSGAGGGGGEYAVGIFSAAGIGVSQTVTIGAGGIANSGSAGGNGGTSSVGSLITAFGGTGGGTVAATGAGGYLVGGLGGTGGAGGNYRSPGSIGMYTQQGSGSIPVIAGLGASSQLGAGGQAGYYTVNQGGSALGYGAGGGGSFNGASHAAYSGGTGSAGIVVIREYVASTSLTPAIPWNDITGTSATIVTNNGYLSDNVGLVTLTLPSTANVGDMIAVQGKAAGGWKIAQNAGQTIHFNANSSTTGTSGYIASSAQYNGVWLVCTTANTDFSVIMSEGILTLN